MSCGSELYNPYCLSGSPTDPYSWAYVNGNWASGSQYNASKLPYATNSLVLYSSNGPQLMYACSSGPCSSEPPDAPWTLVSDTSGPYQRVECTSSGPLPDSQTGACEKSAINGLDALCVNPCIRLTNGKLAVNISTGQCRVFPNATQGGNANVQGTGVNPQCTTVCPQSCVELWETCPPGTAPVTTLIQTKTPTDLLSLTGPLRLDGSPNPLWPVNYVNNVTSGTIGSAILGKPYTECYSYNTGVCDMPMAWQQYTPPSTVSGALGATNTVPGFSACYSTCPAGTFQDPTDPKNCLFVPLSGNFDGYNATTPVQKVFCNPQYFNALYWGSPGSQYAGIQKGCTALALPVKQGSTCVQGTSPIINENFNLEWCLPDCPVGYFFDLTQSTCVATCQGSSNNSGNNNNSGTGGGLPVPSTSSNSTTSYNLYLDYVDFYSTTDRCALNDDGSEKDCVQNYTNGRCPAQQRSPDSSFTLRKLSRAAAPLYGQCPDGMSIGLAANKENEALCYDDCIKGYTSESFCANGAASCDPDQLVYICRASCPSHNEGLGPWMPVDSAPLFTCAYKYPQGTPPSDPNLWISCPDDGRFFVLQNSPTDISVTAATALRKEPLCVRKTYLRQSSCPNGFNAVTDTSKLVTCIKACDSNEMIVTLPDNTVVCQATQSQSSRHDIDFVALADSSNCKAPFKHRILNRKNFTRGLGSDPNGGLSDPNAPKSPWYSSILTYLLIGVGIFVVFYVLKKFTSSKRSDKLKAAR